MADRILTWFLETLTDDQFSDGPVYIMDRDYQPRVVRIHSKRAPGLDVVFDIRDDGVSILDNLLVLNQGSTLEDVAEDFSGSAPTIKRYSTVTLHLTSGHTPGITVQLELVANTDDELTETDT